MFKKLHDKKQERDLIATIAHIWGTTKRDARDYLYLFRKQKTK